MGVIFKYNLEITPTHEDIGTGSGFLRYTVQMFLNIFFCLIL